MTFASPRLIRKRPFILVSFKFDGRQAIGSEVAAETSRSAVTKAPANTVTVSRIELAVIISKTPLHCFVEPDLRVRGLNNAGAVPIEKSCCFSMKLMRYA